VAFEAVARLEDGGGLLGQAVRALPRAGGRIRGALTLRPQNETGAPKGPRPYAGETNSWTTRARLRRAGPCPDPRPRPPRTPGYPW
jgi:hypothetical protein